MKREKKNSHYIESGLDNIYLVNGFKLTKTNNGDEELFIHDVHGLHKAISNTLIFKRGLLEGSEIKFIRTMLDLSQNKLAALIGCRYQQILLWEKNKNKISKPADRLLRIYLYTYLYKEIDNGRCLSVLMKLLISFESSPNFFPRKKRTIPQDSVLPNKRQKVNNL